MGRQSTIFCLGSNEAARIIYDYIDMFTDKEIHFI